MQPPRLALHRGTAHAWTDGPTALCGQPIDQPSELTFPAGHNPICRDCTREAALAGRTPGLPIARPGSGKRPGGMG